MFTLALLIGVYSYIIFLLGLLGLFYKETIISTSIICLLIVFFLIRKKLNVYILKNNLISFMRKTSGLGLGLFSLLFIQLAVNLIGVLGPELGFDALWYHLTLPKIYLANHFINYIPGGLLYYSAMPKLTEMLYAAGLAFGNEISAKFIHFSFGILSLIALYRISRKFLPKNYSLLVLIIFYSNLVVGWMSITAYIDFARTFFEIIALWGFINWAERQEKKWFIVSAVLMGLAISTKLLAIGSLLIFSSLIIYVSFCRKEKIKTVFIRLVSYWIIGLFIALPWFIFSFIHTGNPVYPFFTNVYRVKPNFYLINPLNLSDPISPLYIIFLPVALLLYRKLKLLLKVISLYSFFAIIVWYITPQTGGGRFILPYLPAFSLISVVTIEMINRIRLRYILNGIIIFFALFSISYRGAANSKYIPVILGKESKSQFLTNHLNFSFGDFYDTEGYFTEQIKQGDRVLLYGFHNLYYVNFPFIDSSYIEKGSTFNYVAVQDASLPERFSYWNLIYYNSMTKVKLYSLGGKKWVY
jgi:hypothetical protein